MGPVDRVVALRAAGLGDLLTAVPALRALGDAFPDHELTLVTDRNLASMVPLIEGVDSVVRVRGLRVLPRVLDRADVAVNLHGSGPQSHRVLLAAEPRRLIAHRHAEVPESEGGPPWKDGEHEVVRWARLLESEGIPCDPTRLGLRRPDPTIRCAVGATVVHPGAGQAARRWPLSRWIGVVRRLVADGRRIVLTGSVQERSANSILADEVGLDDGVNLAGRTNVAGLAAIVANSALVLSSDTGIAHLATAYDVPSLTLFGPTPPAEWGPLVQRDIHVVIWSGQRGDPRADRPDEGLLMVGEDQVLAAYEGLVGSCAPALAGR
jgi:ADP-heptose:LPS heptosyltransferase